MHYDDYLSDHELYCVLAEVANQPKVFGILSSEEQVFVEDLKREFESSGVHINDAERKHRLLQLQAKIASLESQYLRNAFGGDSTFTFGPVDDPNSYFAIREYLEKFADQTEAPPKYLICPSQSDVISQMILNLPDRKVRQALWRGSVKAPEENAECLGELIKTRQLTAKDLGYRSHAHKVLSARMAKTPENVQSMLRSILSEIEESVEKELQLLDSGRDALFPWNANYLIRRKALESKEMGNTDPQLALKSYLSLSSVFEGLKYLLHELFSIQMQVGPVPSNEAWGGQQDPSNSGMYKITLQSCGEHLGTVYIDAYRRRNKMNQAAHLTIQCGCVDTKAVVDGILKGEYRHWLPLPRQDPVVTLLFDFAPSVNGELLLSFQELETVYHEFGHALHSILSRTTYQHLSGTRGGVDFVEVVTLSVLLWLVH